MRIFLSFFLIFFLNINNLYGYEKCNNLIQYLNDEDEVNFEYLEYRDDLGIHFDFQFDKELKEIIIKRDEDNYPIVKFSLFENKKIIPGKTSIKKINSEDLSKLDDNKLNNYTYLKGEHLLELSNGEMIKLISGAYKLNIFNLTQFKINSIQNIDTTKGILELSFNSKFQNKRNDFTQTMSFRKDLLNNGLNPICNEFKLGNIFPLESVEFEEFKYDADIREGLKNKEFLAKSIFDITNDGGIIRTLRSESGVGFFKQYFDFKKFPFDTQKLLIRIKTGVSNFKNQNTEDDFGKSGAITFIIPEKGVYYDLEKFINPNVNKLKAWKIPADGIKIKNTVLSNENYYDIYEKKIIPVTENVLDIEITIERNYQHYLFKIMLPVFLILCVAWYVLWIPTQKYEVRLNTSIIALLALIAYNFVFQDDIPKLEYLTNLDWFILLSYIFCCIPVFLSIAFSKFISKNQFKVMKVNKFIKIWGGILYMLITAQIFLVN